MRFSVVHNQRCTTCSQVAVSLKAFWSLVSVVLIAGEQMLLLRDT